MSELQQQHTTNIASDKDPATVGEDSADVVLKLIRNEAKLKSLSQDRAKLLPRSQSQETLGEHPKTQYQQPLLKTSSSKVDSHRVKVAYGDETRIILGIHCVAGVRFLSSDLRQCVSRVLIALGAYHTSLQLIMVSL